MTEIVIPSSTVEPLVPGEEFDGWGRRKIIHPEHVGEKNPKKVGYTRATTFIGALDDTTTLRKWRERLILQGAPEVSLEAQVLQAYENKLNAEGDGKDAKMVEEAAKRHRKELDNIADEAFHYAGGHDAADYGTALHELAESFHRGTFDVRHLADTESRWPGISGDFLAYQEAFKQLQEQFGARVVLNEALLVNDRLKVSGRTDLVLLMKLPGDTRARRIVFDIKTGKIDRKLKLSQQLAIYAGSKLYDPVTGVRTSLRARQDKAIVAHVPRGQEKAVFHLIDLAPGRAANALCERVRASRRKGPEMMQELVIAE